MKRILIVEKDMNAARFIEAALKENGWAAEITDCGKVAAGRCAAAPPDIIVLALEFAGWIGRLRELTRAPFILLTTRGSGDAEKIAAFEKGAEDYLEKPLFGTRELLDRIRAALHNSRAAGMPASYACQHLRVDLARRRVTLHEQKIHLTPTEYNLLAALIGKAGQVMTHGDLLRTVWSNNDGHDHYLRIYVQRLRRKLGDDPFRPRYIFTEPGIGYRLNVDI